MKLLICLLAIFTSFPAAAQLTYETVWPDYDSAWTFRSLKLIPIRPSGPGGSSYNVISLSKALAAGTATISERGTASTENVHWLRIRNHSQQSIYIPSGQTISGGRQDRMVTRDTILIATGGDQYIPVMCIEEGRWSEREKKITYTQYANLRLRKVLDRSRNQVLIWKEIYDQLDSTKIKSPSLAYLALRQNKIYLQQAQEYTQFFQDKFRQADSSITGLLCVSGNKVIGCDIFAGTRLFYGELDALLQGYISEAILRGSPPVMEQKDIERYMDRLLGSEAAQEDYCRKNGKIFRLNNQVIHVSAY